MTLTSERAREIGRIGGHKLHATHDSRDIGRRAQAGLWSKFLREADPDGKLPIEERERRAYHLRQAHFARLAAASAEARRKRKSDPNKGR